MIAADIGVTDQFAQPGSGATIRVSPPAVFAKFDPCAYYGTRSGTYIAIEDYLPYSTGAKLVSDSGGEHADVLANLVWGNPELVEKAPAAASISEIQNFIRSTFGLSMDQLARICRVARGTVYNWKEPGHRPHKTAARRLSKINLAAKNWKESGYPNPGSVLEQPVLNEKSLFDYLMAEEIDQEKIDFIGTRLMLG